MKKQLITISCFLSGIVSYGQTSVNTSGGEVKNTSGSVSYSIGQVAYTSVSNSNGSVSQGVQQAYQISTLNTDEKIFNFSLSAYPNPTQDNLNLRVGNYRQEQLVYRLLDLGGKLLSEAKIQTQETVIEMQQLPNATYFVEVHHENKKVQSFKIIKNQ
jgi:hypothetical protein